MFLPMSEHARRLSSFQDLLISQWLHYLTGNGRTVSHTIAQFFLWIGKDIFNIFNALISVLLIMELYWCANKGIVSFDFITGRLVFIFLHFGPLHRVFRLFFCGFPVHVIIYGLLFYFWAFFCLMFVNIIFLRKS